jgi:hypothetical protein
MKTFRSICISAAVLLVLTSVGHAQTVITSLPFTISVPGNYVLGSNLTFSSATGNAITVNASGVTIDLKGYRIDNPTTSNSAFAIYSSNKASITVKNGHIAGFGVGINLNNTSFGNNNVDHVVEDMRLTNCSIGILQRYGRTSTFRNNQIITEVPGGVGILIIAGVGNRMTGNVIFGYSGGFIAAGMVCTGGNYIDRNTVANCTLGIGMSSSEKYRFNTTFNCTTPFNFGIALFSQNS